MVKTIGIVNLSETNLGAFLPDIWESIQKIGEVNNNPTSMNYEMLANTIVAIRNGVAYARAITVDGEYAGVVVVLPVPGYWADSQRSVNVYVLHIDNKKASLKDVYGPLIQDFLVWCRQNNVTKIAAISPRHKAFMRRLRQIDPMWKEMPVLIREV